MTSAPPTYENFDQQSANTAVMCAHCGLPVPSGLVAEGCSETFCCVGCKGAYQLIKKSGFGSFYLMPGTQNHSFSLKDRNNSSSRFIEFDSDLFLNKFATVNDNAPHQIKLAVDGIHCAACIWLLEKLPNIVPGVLKSRANWSRGTIHIVWYQDQIQLSEIALRIFQLGYTPHPIRISEKEKRFNRENRKHLSRLGIAAALAGNNMIVSAALYFGMFTFMTTEMNTLMRIASCLIGIIALLIPGRVFIASAWQAVCARTPHMDLPIGLALLVGTLVGTLNVVRGTGEIYFDSLSVLIFLLLVGRWMQFRQQARAADAVDLLYRMTPKMTRRIVRGKTIETLVDLLSNGDILEVRAGELIPVDGIVLEGKSQIDESILTGESASIVKQTQDMVFAGTLNQLATIRVETTATGESTRLSRITQLVEASGDNRPRVVQWANQIGGFFVSAVLVLATTTFLWWCNFNLEVAVDRTMALLIVACPCALALATPLAIAVALGRAAQSGMMIKCGDSLQALLKPGKIWLDKTGTLTEGEMRVERWFGDRSCLPLVAAIEQHSIHPIGKALFAYAGRNTTNEVTGASPASDESHSFTAENIQEFLGAGVQAQVESQQICIGNRRMLQRHSISTNLKENQVEQQYLDAGLSPCWIIMNGQVAAIAAVGDALRPDAKQAIERLWQRGWQVGILSGDHQSIVDRVAKRLGIESELALGELSPEEKQRMVQLHPDKTTIMVGDGVNDSVALASATIGIAVKGGAEASLSAAPIYLANSGLTPILDLLELSDITNKTMKRNLGISLAYNIVFASLAFLGYVNPLVAAILMPISSLTVVSLSLKPELSSYKDQPKDEQ
ncbi:MAG: heavy metal translocating P-type ATPase [Planctomycetota bacterium]